MKLEHDFTVPASVDEAWAVLLDVEKVAPCMPGAALTSVDGDSFTGTVKVKVGPIQVTYTGQASFVEKDDAAHRVVIEASGKEARGGGTAAATVTAVLTADGAHTKASVVTDLNITGRPAQFGRGVMADVGAKLIGQFADCLADELAGSQSGSAESETAQSESPKADAPAKTASAQATPAKATPRKTAPTKKAAAKKATAKKAAATR